MVRNKVVTVDALFNELKGSHAYQRGRGTGSSLRVATARAFADMYKKMKFRKTFTKFTATVCVGFDTR
jgi:hypothetical protein